MRRLIGRWIAVSERKLAGGDARIIPGSLKGGLIYMGAETEAIIKMSSYVHDISAMEVGQSICLVCIAICAILVAVNSFFK